MLPKIPIEAPLPRLFKTVGGRAAHDRGAFARHETLTLTVRAPRALGAAAVVLRLAADGGADTDRPFSFVKSNRGWDTYRLSLSFADLCGDAESGLFYFELLFVRGWDTLFTDTADNVHFSLSTHAARRFRLLVYEDNFQVPAWFAGRIVYHIFVDRFAPGGGERRPDAVYHEHWNEEIVQYGAYPGAPVANNEFFGGTLWGILDKLDYLDSLGVGVIYLSPIFRAASNHKYDTGDFDEIDPQFGGEKAFRALLAACRARGVAVMLDGVFNHTGDDSRYFNRYGHYDAVGAYQSENSPYYKWYTFTEYPEKYATWWGIPILPKLNLAEPSLFRYLVGEGGVVQRYTEMGVSAWRLDVADELPDAFLDALRARVRSVTNGEGLVLGEVWENAADKISYGARRRYFQGKQLDSVMDYPLREALVAFAREGDAPHLAAALTELWGSYPRAVCHALLNVLSTHDTERILTVLGDKPDNGARTNAQLCAARMNKTARDRAKRRLRIAAALQYTVFGVPSLFYGDEAGLEGYHDPFCRRPYPWGNEDARLLAFYRKLGRIRCENPVLAAGDFRLLAVSAHAIAFERNGAAGRLIVAANRQEEPFYPPVPRGAVDLLTGRAAPARVGVPPDRVCIWRVR